VPRTTATPAAPAEAQNALQRLIIEHCENTGDTLADVAARGGLARQTVSALAHRNDPQAIPRNATLRKLATGLGMSLSVVQAAATEAAYGQPNGAPSDHRLSVLLDTAEHLSTGSVDVLLATARALRNSEHAV
jgi:transcriptional regulator with XRE-family HTH domain